ncbi:short chain oxidoreductase [Obba rivulosa]|uniref:Short chain oxidoreductase n=1 Tax=Obba rivulosa TaxID=1052685 RepID=A0A8E2B494_9APHY|nr:short chain oxidoreductase [Obba rivulosa]
MSASDIRVALVTGAAQGLGLAIALRLADDGLDIAVNDLGSSIEALHRVVSDIKAKGRRAIAVPADVTSEDDVKNMIDRVAKELGTLDVMVANAGIIILKSLLDTSVEEWERLMAVNVRGVMLSYKYAARQMIKQGRGGRIIGACSTAGKRGSENLSAYCTSKFAVRGLTQSLALELRDHNITVNAYAPGVMMTSMAQLPDDDINGGPGTTFLKTVGLPTTWEIGSPDVVASLVSYLTKPESYFITGQAVNLNHRFFD